MLYIHMRERHSIDDLFRRGLMDAEASPPRAVWEAIAQRRGWGHRLLHALQRRLGYVLAVVLLLSLPIGWWLARSGVADAPLATLVALSEAAATEVSAATSPAMPGSSTNTDGPEVLVGEIVQSAASTPMQLVSTTTQASSINESAPSRTSEMAHAGGTMPLPQPTINASSDEGTNEGVTISTTSPEPPKASNGATGENSAYPVVHSEGSGTLTATAGTSEGSAPGSNVRDAMYDSVVAMPMRGIRTLPVTHAATGALVGGSVTDPYVLPHGNYFFGVQVGYDGLSGGWSGHSPLSEELDRDEQWLGQYHAGIVLGRRWRSGASISVGVGFVERKSRFFRAMQTPGSTMLDVDTVWTGTPSGPNTVYTWDIDSLMTEQPGTEERFNSTNGYRLLRIPVELGWRRELNRWSITARAGVQVNLALDRRGRTLVSGQADGAPVVGDLNDAAVSQRFRTSISGFLGVDVGYLLCDRLSVHLGPVLARDMWSAESGDEQLRLTQVGAVLRLEYELPHK